MKLCVAVGETQLEVYENVNYLIWCFTGKQSDFNPYPTKLIYLNFQPLEVVSRYRDPQPEVAENYSYLFNLRLSIYKYWCLNSHFIPNKSDLKRDLKRLLSWLAGKGLKQNVIFEFS